MGIKWFPGTRVIRDPNILSNEAIKASPRKKIVIINWQPWYTDKIDLSWADLVIFFTTECIEQFDTLERGFIEQYNVGTKFICVAGGANTDFEPSRRYYIRNPEVFAKVVCSNMPHVDNISTKTKLFDALLGTPKTTRLYIFNQLKQSGLLEQSLVNLMKQFDTWIPTDPWFPHLPLVTYSSPELAVLESEEVSRVKSDIFCSADLAGGMQKLPILSFATTP